VKPHRLKALLKVKLTVALTRAALARSKYHDRRKARDVTGVATIRSARCSTVFAIVSSIGLMTLSE
jgi:hypothetical protein